MTPEPRDLSSLRIIIRGAGDLATGVALCLWRSGFRRILMLEVAIPLAVRRTVAFSEAVYQGQAQVEGIAAERLMDIRNLAGAWDAGYVGVMVDPDASCLVTVRPHVLVEATLSKRNIGLSRDMAPLVVALGPGYTAGVEAHLVVETNRGDQLGRVITRGAAQANTGLPAPVQGFTWERVLRAPTEGVFRTEQDIGQRVRKGQAVGRVGGTLVMAGIDGLIRGLLRDKTPVRQGTKLGDIDPRSAAVCDMVSDKALAIGGGVLEALLGRFLASHLSSGGLV